MTKTRQRLQVVKVPLEYQPCIKPAIFPPMPTLYLELLENKLKVKPSVRNKEHMSKETPIANDTSSLGYVSNVDIFKPKTVHINDDELKVVSKIPTKTSKKEPLRIMDLSDMSSEQINAMNLKVVSGNNIPSLTKSLDKAYRNINDNKTVDTSNDLARDDKYYSNEERARSHALKLHYEPSKTDDNFRKEHYHRTEDRDNRPLEYKYRSSELEYKPSESKYKSSESHYRSSDNGESKYKQSDNRESKYRPSESERHKLSKSENNYSEQYSSDKHSDNRESQKNQDRINLQNKDQISSIIKSETTIGLSLDDILKGKTVEKVETKETYIETKTATDQGLKKPPTLAEIQAGKVNVDSSGIRNIEHITVAEQDDVVKIRDIRFKLKTLKRMYPSAAIPDFSEHTPLGTLEREYQSYVRQLSLDATVENYKKYLTIAFFVLEFVFVNVIKLKDFAGFSSQQMLGMNQYERILFEIGEKSYFTPGKTWSPEMKLAGIICLNTAVFIGSKLLFKATGNNIMNIINGSNGQNNNDNRSREDNQHQNNQARTGKMRGPNINLADLGTKKYS
jgi:hypothetical protein